MSVEDRWHKKVNGKRVRTAEYGKGAQWEIRWRQGGRQYKARRTTKHAADLLDAERKVNPEIGRRPSQVTVAQMMDAWLATVSVRESTLQAYRLEVAEVNKTFGDRLAASLKPSEVRAWVARPHPGASIRRRSLITLRRAYKLAIADRVLLADPTEGARLPTAPREDPQFLTWEALAHLASCAGPDAPLIWLLGTTGLRLSEAIGLDQTDIDRVRCRVRVRKSKTAKGVRDVPVDPEVLALLPTAPGPVFCSPAGGRWNTHNWRERRFRKIREAAGLSDKFTPHSLRHSAASLAIASGADVGVVQEMLGHASAAVTFSVYHHLFAGALDTAATKMADARRTAGVQMSTPAAITSGEDAA